MEYILSGDQEVTIRWDIHGSKTREPKEKKNGRKGTKK
jgi:hypothetical protein